MRPSTSRSFHILTCHCDFNTVCTFVGLHYNKCIIMHGMKNAKLITVSVSESMALTYKMMTVSNSFWIIFIVVPCMLLQSLLYCSNPCNSLHFKTLKSHTKILKICPYMFWSPLKPSSGGPWPYFATSLNWNVDLHSFWIILPRHTI